MRFIRGHNKRRPALERFSEKFDVSSDGCWGWVGPKTGNGYAVFSVDGRHRVAHRWIYEQLIGAVAGLEVDHLCRNRACVNPDHLEAVTKTENIRRGASPTLTVAVVAHIRSLAPEAYDRRQLAGHYGVSPETISSVRHQRSWRAEV